MIALVFVLAFDRGFLARACDRAAASNLGEWSYAIYMGQTFWLQLIRIFEQRLYPPDDDDGGGYALRQFDPGGSSRSAAGVCIVWGALLATLIEHPARHCARSPASAA